MPLDREDGEVVFDIDINAMEQALKGTGWTTGWAVTPVSGQLKVSVAKGSGRSEGTVKSTTGATQVTLDAADATHPRKDLIVYDASASALGKVTGIPAAIDPAGTVNPRKMKVPKPPDLGESTDIIIACVYVPANCTDADECTIIDKRVALPVMDHGDLDGLDDRDHDAAYLAKENTAPFTPDADYEPAPKKYVDDNVTSYPHFAICFGAYSGSVGTWTITLGQTGGVAASFFIGNTTHADGDYVEYKVTLPAGTYHCLYGLVRAGDQGIIKFYVDGVLKKTTDCYNPTAEFLAEDVSFVVSTTGNITLRWKVDGKNASSSSYNCKLYEPVVGRSE